MTAENGPRVNQVMKFANKYTPHTIGGRKFPAESLDTKDTLILVVCIELLNLWT